MTAERPGPPRDVPTLTEVVSWPEAGQQAAVGMVPEPTGPPVQDAPGVPVPEREPPLDPQPPPEREPPGEPVPVREPPALPEGEPVPPPIQASAAVTPAPVGAATPPDGPPIDEEQLTEDILRRLQSRVDLDLEMRLRDLLAPILNRATDALVRDASAELSCSLRDLVARSVAQELLRQRTR
ncbi:MAG: hypothetical protein ABI809_01975 [Caldimonas sp.]